MGRGAFKEAGIIKGIAAALGILAGTAGAAWSSDSSGLERKARKVASQDAEFAQLRGAEADLVVHAVAKKLREIRHDNRKNFLKKRKKLTDADISIYITDSDLDTLKERYQKALKGKKVISAEETRDPDATRDVTVPGDIIYEEVHSDPFHGLFADNEWEILEGSADAADLRAQAADAVERAGSDGKIAGLTIIASASALRNTGKAAKMTHQELSRQRALAALKFILQELQSKGIVLDKAQVTLDVNGENGDGTSGPADPYGKGSKGNGEAPYRDTTEYDQHKYVDVTFLIETGRRAPDTSETVVAPGEEHARLVALDIDTKTNIWRKHKKRTKLRLRHRHPKKTKRKKLKKGKPIPCPDFS